MQRIEDSGRKVMLLSYDQLDAFAGNMLELRTAGGRRLVALSQRAFDSLGPEQRAMLEQNGDILAVPIDTIEASAGGSVRCMLAEIHLPANN